MSGGQVRATWPRSTTTPYDGPSVDPYDPRNCLLPRPVHQDRTTALLVGVENPQETEMPFLAEDLARERWSRDLSTARTAQLAHAIRRRRAAERSRARARLLLRLAGAATRRSDRLASTSDYTLAR